jgi:hypothetical protein
LVAKFEEAVRDHTAGDPMDERVRWTNLTQAQIAAAMDAAGIPVSRHVVRQLLARLGFVKRKARKTLALGAHPDRNAQFENIARLKREYQKRGQPVISIDTKKKELLGNFAPPGQLFTREPVQVFDHDFGGQARGVAIPHGVYDLRLNRGHVTLGISHDTSEFAADSLLLWWRKEGLSRYPDARRLLVLCDAGGSNGCTHLFKSAVQRVADETGLEIRVAHYPPYTSKYNPIEHRLFPHLSRACRGVVLHTVELVRNLMETAHTATGLEVSVDILRRMYQTGLKATAEMKDQLQLLCDDHLGKWNYRLFPNPT